MNTLAAAPKEVDAGGSFLSEIIKSLSTGRQNKVESKSYKPSSLYDPCIVKEALRRKRNVWDSGPAPDAKVILAMEAGTAVHERLQSQILPKTARLWGNWRCRVCKDVRDNCFLPAPCPNQVTRRSIEGDVVVKCHDEARQENNGWEYLELRIKDPEYGISGRCDGIWMLEDGTWFVLELKSCSSLAFEDLARRKIPTGGYSLYSYKTIPSTSHMFQSNLYVWLLFLAAHRHEFILDPDKCGGCLLAYINRDSYEPRVWKFEPTNSAYLKAVETIQQIEDLAKTDNPLLGPKRCTDRNSAHAKTCPFSSECFPYKRAPKKA